MKSRLLRPRLRTYLAVIAVIGTLLTVAATPASASVVVLTENFEGSSASTWTFNGGGRCQFCGYVEDDYIVAHSGTKSAFIETFYWLASFYSVGKSVSLPQHRSCGVRLYLEHVGPANIEVIDPSSWTYVALLSLPGTAVDYQQQSLSWSGGPSTVYFRVSTVSDSSQPDPWANVDDITITCS